MALGLMGVGLLVLAFVLIGLGIVGSVVPALPGPPIAWAGLLVGSFSAFSNVHPAILVLTAAATLFVTVADYIFPSMMTKKGGGTKAGSWGANVGLVVGCVLGSIPGVLLGPFLGALAFELIADSSDFQRALRSAKGAFVGFLLGTGMKLMLVLTLAWVLILSLLPFARPSAPSEGASEEAATAALIVSAPANS